MFYKIMEKDLHRSMETLSGDRFLVLQSVLPYGCRNSSSETVDDEMRKDDLPWVRFDISHSECLAYEEFASLQTFLEHRVKTASLIQVSFKSPVSGYTLLL